MSNHLNDALQQEIGGRTPVRETKLTKNARSINTLHKFIHDVEKQVIYKLKPNNTENLRNQLSFDLHYKQLSKLVVIVFY